MPDRLVMSSHAQATDVIARSHRLVWGAAGGLAASAMGGYVLTRIFSGFLGDHSDVGNWRCPLGLAALSVETLLILLAVWQARSRRTALALPPRLDADRMADNRIPENSHAG